MRLLGTAPEARSDGDETRWRDGESRGTSGGVRSAIGLRPAAVAYLFGSLHPASGRISRLKGVASAGGCTAGPGRHGFLFNRVGPS
jgi:hypothetical protein